MIEAFAPAPIGLAMVAQLIARQMQAAAAKAQQAAAAVRQRPAAAPKPYIMPERLVDKKENRPEFSRPAASDSYDDFLEGLLGTKPAGIATVPQAPKPGLPGLLGGLLSDDQTGAANVPHTTDPKTGKLVALPAEPKFSPFEQGVGALQRSPVDRDRYLNATPEQQKEIRKNVAGTSDRDKTVAKMLEDVDKDPIQDPMRKAAMTELANLFRDESRSRYFTNQDIIDNPTLKWLNDISIWSSYRIKVADWKAGKQKSGSLSVLPTTDSEGDGTFTGLVENGSFSSVTSPSALPPYLVVRDEHGLLTVVNADQWIQGKFTDMHKDPKLAAETITALALVSAYGNDSAAKGQGSRVAVDREGNPVKAIVSAEDLAALKQFANEAAIWQNNGEEVAIDDMLAEATRLGVEVSAQNGANGEYSGGGGGGGFGGGGGGGGAVRYTDPTQLGALVDSISRQRMGRSLTPEERAQFVQYYHGLEEQTHAAFSAGQSFTMLDAEGQAIAWVQNHFQQESAANQYGELAAKLFQMMNGNPFGGIA